MTIYEARQRVQRGAKLLDAEKPGWRAQVNPETLAMESGCGCVLGQAYGDFDLAVDALRPAVRDLKSYCDVGFLAVTVADYVILEDAWLELLG